MGRANLSGGQHDKGGSHTCSVKAAQLGAHFKCLNRNVQDTGNKQGKFKIHTQLQSYDLIRIMETWWESSPIMSAPMEGYRLFRKDRVGR